METNGSLLDKLQIVYESFLESDDSRTGGYMLGYNMLQILRGEYSTDVLEYHIDHICSRNRPPESQISMFKAIKLESIRLDIQDLCKGKVSFFFQNLMELA